MIQTVDIPRPDRGRQPATWLCLDVARMDYNRSLDLQHRLVAARKAGALRRDAVLILEHPPVFTLGKRGGRENLRVSPEFLEHAGVDVVAIERGGNITYHGPGQLVTYIICDLHAARIGVNEFVHRLEEIMIRIAADHHVAAARNSANRGIWVGNSKLGSIGIALRRGVTFHGLAFNVNPSMEQFGWINPCGLTDAGVTSIEKETGRATDMDKVRGDFKHHFTRLFEARLEPVTLAQLTPLLTETP